MPYKIVAMQRWIYTYCSPLCTSRYTLPDFTTLSSYTIEKPKIFWKSVAHTILNMLKVVKWHISLQPYHSMAFILTTHLTVKWYTRYRSPMSSGYTKLGISVPSTEELLQRYVEYLYVRQQIDVCVLNFRLQLAMTCQWIPGFSLQLAPVDD